MLRRYIPLTIAILSLAGCHYGQETTTQMTQTATAACVPYAGLQSFSHDEDSHGWVYIDAKCNDGDTVVHTLVGQSVFDAWPMSPREVALFGTKENLLAVVKTHQIANPGEGFRYARQVVSELASVAKAASSSN